MLLGKAKLDIIEVLISKPLINIYINNDEFVSVNNVLRDEWKKKSKILKMMWICYIKAMVSYCVSCKKNTANENSSVRKAKQNRLMLVSNCAACGKKKSKFIKKRC